MARLVRSKVLLASKQRANRHDVGERRVDRPPRGIIERMSTAELSALTDQMVGDDRAAVAWTFFSERKGRRKPRHRAIGDQRRRAGRRTARRTNCSAK
jgi:hypothetical protein